MPRKSSLDRQLGKQTALAFIQNLREEVADKLGPLWEPNIDNIPQQKAYTCKADRLFYGGAAGGGKLSLCPGFRYALNHVPSFTGDNYNAIIHLVPQEIRDLDSKVLMWDGQWKECSALEVGDRIMNPDGQVQDVLHIFSLESQPCYRFHFEDGTTAECSEDHLWGFWEARANSRRKTSVGPKPILDTDTPDNWNINYITRARVRNTKWLVEQLNKGRQFIFPVNAPLNYTNLHRGNSDRAYLYGLLLGDGHLEPKGSACTLTTADKEISDFCYSICEKIHYSKEENKACWDLRLKDAWIGAWKTNSGLRGKRSWEKFIPPGYLKESLDFRWALAQGLFDTDGWAAKDRTKVEYTTVSEQLAEDVANLVRSLGFMAKVSSKQGGYRNESGELVKCRIAYTVSVQGNRKYRLFRLERKRQCAIENEATNWVGKRLERIESIGEEYGRCIKVSNPNSLYITDGYNVTHNSDLLLGLALTAHTDSIVFRREYPQLRELVLRTKDLLRGTGASYNKTDKFWKDIPGKRTLEFGAVQLEDDREKFQGRPHDLVGFDELTTFTKSQFEFLIGWNRTSSRAPRDQRCRIVCTGNPPVTPEGQWVMEYWAPWLDSEHELYPHPPGELIWYASVGGIDTIVSIGDERPPNYILNPGTEFEEEIEPHSRTFIAASLTDNPYLNTPAYRANLQGLPEPLRSQLLFGSFQVEVVDHPWQVIPSAWVEDAFARWRAWPKDQVGGATAMGVDVARGGDDETIISIRRSNYFDELITFPGSNTPDGPKVAAQILKNYKSGIVSIDATGVGGSPYDSLRGVVPIFPIGGGEMSKESTRNGNLGFFNKKSEMIWKLREALDPDFGQMLALPPDNRLKAELCAYHWSVRPPSIRQQTKLGALALKGQIQVDEKRVVKEKLGRSPDRMDALLLAHQEAPAVRKSTGSSRAGW